MAVAYVGSTLLPPLLGFLASFSSIGIFPVYLGLMAAAMLLFSERLNRVMELRTGGGEIGGQSKVH
ncbi:hypothetical protein D3C73_1668910 [compost metagenome]